MQIFSGEKFKNPIEIIQAFDNESFIEAFNKMESLRKHPNYCLLGYIRYEAKEIFLGEKIESKYPLLYFEVFKKEKVEKGRGNDYIKNQPLNISPIALIDYKTYKKALDQVKEEIACGNTYQVNYTYDYNIKTELGGFDLYNSILPNQITPYNAYIKNEFEEILCFSPELFFELENNIIKTKPMKGTVKRGLNEEEDKKNIEFLKNDIKNRAENVMIVDLLRNDLGKIAKTGSVKVDNLFEVETHNTLFQMTSEVRAELDENTTLFEIFEAIFPCGSITGAPKINTMKIIDKLEIGQRGVYCGAIGLISSEKTIFTVPIRTLQKKNNEDFFTCRVGGAVVWDSTPEDEWEETLTKIKFLNADTKVVRPLLPDNLTLIETILVENGELKYKDEHFYRMKKSAKELGFAFDETILGQVTGNSEQKTEGDYILRISLSKEGTFKTQHLPLDKIKTNKVVLSKISVQSNEKFLYHKTTYRPWYDDTMAKIKDSLIFDEIFFNEKGELTEGGRSNLVLQIGGELLTPPLECGLLKGILRQKMIDGGNLKEKKLYIDDLQKAEKIFCINSVRGIVEVKVDFN